MDVKNQERVIAFDDTRAFKDKCFLIGVVYRGSKMFDGFCMDSLKRDGLDATEKIISCVKKLNRTDISYILLDGITYAGFNLVDIEQLYKETNLPVIAFISKYPNLEKIEQALRKHFNDHERRLRIIQKAGKIHKLNLFGHTRYFQCYGLSVKRAKLVLKKSCLNSPIPEALRVANIIAKSFEVV